VTKLKQCIVRGGYCGIIPLDTPHFSASFSVKPYFSLINFLPLPLTIATRFNGESVKLATLFTSSIYN